MKQGYVYRKACPKFCTGNYFSKKELREAVLIAKKILGRKLRLKQIIYEVAAARNNLEIQTHGSKFEIYVSDDLN